MSDQNSPSSPISRVTAAMVQAFCNAYAAPGFEFPDPTRVRLALEAALGELPAEYSAPQIQRGFIAYGESNTSDGRGPRSKIGEFETLEGALQAARGRGVQGSDGYVSRFQRSLIPNSSKLAFSEHRVTDRRLTPERSYSVGFLDFREYEYAARLASLGPVRPAPTSILQRGIGAIGDAESTAYPLMDAKELRHILLTEPGVWVGLWRRRGEVSWRGEFSGTTDRELSGWLPEESHLELED